MSKRLSVWSQPLRYVGRPWAVAAVVIAAYLVVLLISAQGDPLVFVRVGTRFGARDPEGSIGYDGQFYYYVARDPARGWQLVDIPAYRTQRILYPLIVHLLALGDQRLVPWMMVAVGLISVAASVAVVETLLVERGISRWYALPVGLCAGQVFSVVAVLAEPLALCLSLLAILTHARGRWVRGAILFALAGLTKETLLIVAAGYVLYMLRQGQTRRALLTGALVGVPFTLWQVCLRVWLGAWGLRAGGAGATSFQFVPFGALFWLARMSWLTFALFAAALIPIVVYPTLWAIGAAGRAVLAGTDHSWTYALLLYAGVIPFLPASTALDLSAITRFVGPLVALAVLHAAGRRSHRVLQACLLWITTVVLVPFL